MYNCKVLSNIVLLGNLYICNLACIDKNHHPLVKSTWISWDDMGCISQRAPAEK